MRKNIFTFILLFLISFNSWATHIVGGELGFKHITGTTYEISLILYFDKANGDPGARDNSVQVHTFSKATNTHIDSYTLPLVSASTVPYTNPECAIGNLRTEKLVYKQNYKLPYTSYSNSLGYYMSWERCCRNNIIENIVGPENTGQTFYLEFPAMVKDGSSFFNSSPELFPPLGDYGCVGHPFYFDFSGTDPDGDSLAYFLTTPLRGNSTPAVPAPFSPIPAPYPLVTFKGGYSLTNMIKGTPSLAIDPTSGFLTVTPSEAGLFVFALACVEYRDGKKIGEVRRDFQMLVLECPDYNPPVAEVTDASGTPIAFPDTLTYYSTDLDTCINIRVYDTDPDAVITSRIEYISGPTSSSTISPEVVIVPSSTDLVDLTFCMPKCPSPTGEPYVYNIIVEDNSCALPLADTIPLVINVLPSLNDPADFTLFDATALTEVIPDSCYTVDLLLGEVLDFGVKAVDINKGNVLELYGNGDSFAFSDYGMDFPFVTKYDSVSSKFYWETNCDIVEPGFDSAEFTLQFILRESDHCQVLNSDTIFVKVNLKVPDEPNTNPYVYSTVFPDASLTLVCDTVYIGDTFVFPVIVEDNEADSIGLYAFGRGFPPTTLGMDFTPVVGYDSLGEIFSWTPDCDALDSLDFGVYEKDFYIDFVGIDYNDCHKETVDTLTLKLRLIFIPEPNSAPELKVDTVTYSPQLTQESDGCFYREMYVDDSITFNLIGEDVDADYVTISAIPDGFVMSDVGMVFTPVEGIATQNTSFSWKVNCEYLADDFLEKEYKINFVITDINNCDLQEADTVCVRFTIRDREQLGDFLPANIFTPNSDGQNQFFTMPDLPIDNCKDEFESIEVYNRWGKKVFSSADRNFAWEATGFPAGNYNYFIKFKNSSFKGWVQLMR